jgi:hypothetical protein
VRRSGFVFVGRVNQKVVDGERAEFDSGGIRWIIYSDIVHVVIDAVFGPSPGDPRMRLYPIHCEAYRDGVRVDMNNSLCSARTQVNSVDVGERIIGFSEGLPSNEAPPFLQLRLLVNANDMVDVTPLAEEARLQPTAALSDFLRRIAAVKPQSGLMP